LTESATKRDLHGNHVLAQTGHESRVLGLKRGPYAWALRRVFEERWSHIVLEKCGSEAHVLYLHRRESRILEQKRRPRIWVLRRVFEERGSRVSSKKHGSEPCILYIQSKLQLQNFQFVVDGRDTFADVQHSG